MKQNKSYSSLLVLAVIIASTIVGCSTKKNTAFNRFRHSFNTRYNILYNGSQAFIDASVEKEKGNMDNFTEIIPLYTVGNKSSRDLGKSNYDRAIEKCEKAIKLHSIKTKPEWNKSRRKTAEDIEWLNRREYNPIIWKAWMMMGKSQFQKGEFEASAATFSYMSRLYRTNPAVYAQSRAWLAKCYIEQDWLYDAEDVIRNIQRDSIPPLAAKEMDFTLADYYVHTRDYQKAADYLRKVIRHEKRSRQKAREYYLLGQVYTALNQRQEAYQAYRKAASLDAPYELEFNARIAMTEVMAEGQSGKMISRLKRMARNDNNKEYLDQVYYAMGNIYLLQQDTAHAVGAFEKGNRESKRNGIEKGVLLLRLGNLYWDMEKFSDAARCYNEAIGLLDKERDDYAELDERSKKLDKLTPFTESIHLQDSLQALARMSEKDRNEAIDRVIDALKKKEKEERDRQQEAEAEKVMAKNGAQNTKNNAQTSQLNIQNPQDKGKWYFYNPLAVSQGKQTFQRQWGKRENADHWQRANKSVVDFSNDSDEISDSLTDEQRDSLAAAEALEDSLNAVQDSAVNDPHKREYYLAQIPFTEDQLLASNLELMSALYGAGVAFKDQLNNLQLSEKMFRRLENDFPDAEQMADAYYHMFLLYSRMQQPSVAATYIDKLKAGFPDNHWTLLLSDPDFTYNQKFGVHIEDSLYASTYDAFRAGATDVVLANCRLSDERFPMGANRDKFIFIGGLSRLNEGDPDGCLEDMNLIVKDYSQSKLSEMAGMIINGVKKGRTLRGGKFDIADVWNRRTQVLNDSDAINQRQFSDDQNMEHLFVIAYLPDSVDENRLLFNLARYNFSSYLVRNFALEIEALDGLHLMLVTGFNNYAEALGYAQAFYRQRSIRDQLGSARTYVISKENKEMLGTTHSFADYEEFYQQHFADFHIETNSESLHIQPDVDTSLDDGGSAPEGLDLNPEPLPAEEETTAGELDEPAEKEPPTQQGSGVKAQPSTEPQAPVENDNDYDFDIEGF